MGYKSRISLLSILKARMSNLQSTDIQEVIEHHNAVEMKRGK